MSRGLGALQRRVLSTLAARGSYALSLDVAATVFATSSVTPAQDAATRRALRGLAARGLVVRLPNKFRRGQHAWASPDAAAAYQRRVSATFGDAALTGVHR